jgi:hypothetical protein
MLAMTISWSLIPGSADSADLKNENGKKQK